MDYYVRTKQGEFRDDRHVFTTKFKGVMAGEISSMHLEHPNLEILTAEQFKKQGKKDEPEPVEEAAV